MSVGHLLTYILFFRMIEDLPIYLLSEWQTNNLTNWLTPFTYLLSYSHTCRLVTYSLTYYSLEWFMNLTDKPIINLTNPTNLSDLPVKSLTYFLS